jgi:hypothetical protein
MIVNTMQALFLTHNFFARFCDSAGNFVTTQEEALVSESTLSTVNHQPVMQTYTPVELVPVYPEAVQAEEAAKASATALAEPQNLIPAVENYTAPIVVDSESNAPSTGVVTGEGTLQSAIEDAVVMTVEEPTSTVIEEGAAAEPASTEIEKTMTTAIDESGVAPIEIDPAKVGASSAKKTTAKK